MKKLSAIVLAFVLSLSLLTVFAFAAEPSVKVTVANENGELVVIREAIDLTDADGDGALTVNDAMILVHNAKFEGGAEAGFATEDSQYGPMITKFWGVENGGGYGYYVNDEMSFGLSDPLKDGDDLYAFIYTDTTAWSDTYSYFDVKEASVLTGETLKLTLSCAGFDEGGSPAVFPVDEGKITIDGKETGFVTKFTGEVEITFDAAGTYLVSATSGSKNLVPPVCAVTVTQDPNAQPVDPPVTEDPEVITPAPSSSVTEKTDDEGPGTVWLIVGIAAGVVLVACVVFVLIKQKKENEK